MLSSLPGLHLKSELAQMKALDEYISFMLSNQDLLMVAVNASQNSAVEPEYVAL